MVGLWRNDREGRSNAAAGEGLGDAVGCGGLENRNGRASRGLIKGGGTVVWPSVALALWHSKARARDRGTKHEG